MMPSSVMSMPLARMKPSKEAVPTEVAADVLETLTFVTWILPSAPPSLFTKGTS
jgi:hypothetical protein